MAGNLLSGNVMESGTTINRGNENLFSCRFLGVNSLWNANNFFVVVQAFHCSTKDLETIPQ